MLQRNALCRVLSCSRKILQNGLKVVAVRKKP